MDDTRNAGFRAVWASVSVACGVAATVALVLNPVNMWGLLTVFSLFCAVSYGVYLRISWIDFTRSGRTPRSAQPDAIAPERGDHVAPTPRASSNPAPGPLSKAAQPSDPAFADESGRQHESLRETGRADIGASDRVESLSAVTETISTLEHNLTADTAKLLLTMITSPREIVARVSESVEPSSRTLGITSIYTLHVPSALAGKEILLPLTTAKRGVLLDSVRVTDDKERRHATLEMTTAAACVTAAIRQLLGGLSPDLRQGYIDAVEADVFTLLTASKPVTTSGSAEITSWFQEARTTAGLSDESRKRLGWLLWTIEKLRSRYPIVVSGLAPSASLLGVSEMRFTIHRRVIPDQFVGQQNLASKWLENLRIGFGVSPSAVAIRLRSAERARSYHLIARGPEGTYMARQRLIDHRASASPLWIGGSRRAMRMRRGQRYGHLYLRDAEFSNHSDPFYVAYFYERPPGSTAAPLFSSLAALLMIVIAAYVSLGFADGPRTDIVVVLLSLPAVIGAWAGVDRDTRIAGPRIGARLASIGTIVVTLAAVLLYFVTPSDIDPDLVLGSRPWFWAWATVVFLALVIFIACAGAWGMAMAIYAYFVRRLPEGSLDGYLGKVVEGGS